MTNAYSHKWHAFIGITLLSFGCYLDYTIVNIALPTIQEQLHVNLNVLQWVMNIYFLALCVLATVMGRCGDIYGRRKVFYIGVVIFAIGSVLAGLAHNIHYLIIGRLLQGIGAAIVFPLGPSLLPQSFPEHERRKAIAWFGGLGGVALALGPVLGGLIVRYWGWEWIFFINIPLAILGYLFCRNSLVEFQSADNLQEKLDWGGSFFLAITIGALVLGLIHSQEHGWDDYFTIGYMLLSLISCISLIRTESKNAYPIIDFKDFKKILFFAAVSLILLAGVLSAVCLFFDPLYLQILRRESPQFSGLILFSIPIAVFIIAFLVDKIISRLGLIKTIFLGILLGVLATFLQVFFTSSISLLYVLLSFFILGSMWALGNTVSIIAAQTAVGEKRASVATGTIVTMFNIGGSIGLALAVVVYHKISLLTLESRARHHPLFHLKFDSINQLIANPTVALQLNENNLSNQMFNGIFNRGFSGVMMFLTLFSLLLFFVLLFKKVIHKRFSA